MRQLEIPMWSVRALFSSRAFVRESMEGWSRLSEPRKGLRERGPWIAVPRTCAGGPAGARAGLRTRNRTAKCESVE